MDFSVISRSFNTYWQTFSSPNQWMKEVWKAFPSRTEVTASLQGRTILILGGIGVVALVGTAVYCFFNHKQRPEGRSDEKNNKPSGDDDNNSNNELLEHTKKKEEEITTTTLSIESLEQKDPLCEKISSIRAGQIELIGMRIENRIFAGLDPINKARITQQVMQKKGEKSGPEHTMMLLAMMDVSNQESQQFFSGTIDTSKFRNTMLWSVTGAIKNTFSNPMMFLRFGERFQLSDYDPMGVLKEALNRSGIDVTLMNVPPKYDVCLKLDQELTQQKSELVFTLIKISEGIEFSRENFTIEELEQEFYSSLKKFK